ncbi:MAG TPA: hypothetical protein PK523_09830 [Elusimicrobiales bacterium]|nr:hypothetical protein [Elusimicrobiales bacterium]
MVFLVSMTVMASMSCVKAGTLENLEETGLKISEIDMDKNFGAAGEILDGFYTGQRGKKPSSTPVVHLDAVSPRNESAYSEKELCNAEPLKIRKISSKVPPLAGSPADRSAEGGFPAAGGSMVIGVLAIGAVAVRKSFWDDVETVVDAATNPIDTYNDFQAANAYEQSQQQSSPQPVQHTVTNVVHDSSGSVTTSTSTDSSCASSSTACYGDAWLQDQLN